MKTNPEFDNFTTFMGKLAQAPHSELKTALDIEKADKAHEAKARKLSRKLRDDPDNGNARFIVSGKDSPLVQVANEVFRKAARRKVN